LRNRFCETRQIVRVVIEFGCFIKVAFGVGVAEDGAAFDFANEKETV
jgi:hypothetical protein